MLGLMSLEILAACKSDTFSDYDYASLVEDLRAAGLNVDPHLTEESQNTFFIPANVMYIDENYSLPLYAF